MTYSVVWNKKASKSLKRIHPKDRIKILAKTRELKFWSKVQGVKILKNFVYSYRLRVGDYRIFFDIDEAVKIVKIEEVRKRDERTY